MKKNSSTLVSKDQVNETQRKSLGLGTYEKRERDPAEALPRTIAYNPKAPKATGPLWSIRAGGNDHLQHKSRGF